MDEKLLILAVDEGEGVYRITVMGGTITLSKLGCPDNLVQVYQDYWLVEKVTGGGPIVFDVEYTFEVKEVFDAKI